ncbi:MAG: nucleotidyltransferase substrate binding protein [Prevotella sp.]|nr:nucleotidyltransferase substrate binding protein [Prevotella sp.]
MEENRKSKVDVRWIQRFSNYRKALHKLSQAVDIVSVKMDWGEEVDDLLQEGLIQRFEYTHELAWKVMKDYAEYQGYTDVKGSRDAFRKGLEMRIIDSEMWMESIEDRNLTSHNYDDKTAHEVYTAIVEEYYPLFKKFENEMLRLSGL